MNKQIITFEANEQSLIKTGGIEKYSSNKVGYIEAHFDLQTNWTGYDSVRAVWHTNQECISTVLDTGNKCIVPYEVLQQRGNVWVNLVGSISEDNVLTDRLTTYPVLAVEVDADAMICGSETRPITPSQFEQFVAIVQSIVDGVKDIDRAALNEDYTLTIYYTDGTSDTVGPIRGEQGATGPTGNGITSIAKTGTSGTNPVVDTYTITYTNGQTDTFTVTNGIKGDTGNGIQSIYKTGTSGAVDTYTILFTDGNTTEFTVTNGEVTNAAMAAAIEQAKEDLVDQFGIKDTASGTIASFPDGAQWAAKSVVADIDPVQDLHGYDKPWAAGANKNLWNGKWVNTSFVESSTWSAELYAGNEAMPIKEGSVYTASLNGTVVGIRYAFLDADKVQIGSLANANVTVAAPTGAKYLKWRERDASVQDGKYQIEEGSTASAWTPYSNICPISGWTGVNVNACGFNVWDEEWEVGDIRYTDGQNDNTGDRIRSKNYISARPSTQYCCTLYSTRGVNAIFFYDKDKNYLGHYADLTTSHGVFTTPSDCCFIRFRTYVAYGTTYNHDISINYPSTETAYRAYDGDVYPISWQTEAGTVYGGYVDVVSGVLTVDRATVLLTGTEQFQTGGAVGSDYRYGLPLNTTSWQSVKQGNGTYFSNYFEAQAVGLNSASWGEFYISSSWLVIHDKDKTFASLDDFKTWVAACYSGNEPIQISYELATPTTYQLTPTQVALLLGTNNVWSDTGDTEVTYVADTKKYIDKMTA